MKRGPIFGLIFFALPSFAFAQVVINEVMYNPKGSDSGREWIELYNEGQSDVTMVGGSGKNSWRISDSSNHTITDPAGGTGRGSLTIPAGGYLVIASDPNEFISGEYAGSAGGGASGAYSVAKASISLNNTGATLSLLDGTGTTVDSVSYTSAQGGNDDGSSLQRQADGSWIAALPTPGQANSITPYVAPPADTPDTSQMNDQPTASTTDQSSQSNTPSPNSSYVPPPTPNLFADAGEDRTVIVGADVEFDASAYDKQQDLLDPTTVRFSWNFGDGSTAEGPAVLHHFSYPGRYAVTLNIALAKNAASDELTVTAEPAALSFSLLSDGGVRIEDLAGHDLDLSGWVVRENGTTFAAQFILPEHSEILSGSSMNISAQTLSFRASSSTLLEYPNGAVALGIGGSSASSTAQQAQPQETTPSMTEAAPTPPPKAADKEPEVLAGQDLSVEPDPEGSDADSAQATSSLLTTDAPAFTQTAAASAPVSNHLWWLGVFALALAAGAATLAFGHFKKGEWDIVEDKTE
ncbi:MAG TPA: lamin tail domain-containing protein [Candidatus Paceibacterota bacterium]|nr:lamin tail domain-containing protein [Candidatus Paceibacterota bacterium]